MKLKKYLLLILSILFFLVASLQEHQALSRQPEIKLIQTFQQTLLKQELKLSEYLNVVEREIKNNLPSGDYISTFSSLNKLFDDEGFGFIIFDDQKMVYWSSNQFSFHKLPSVFSNKDELWVLPNGIFVAKKRIIGKHQIIGLIHIKNNYSYENQFLQNNFIEPFKLPSNFKINIQKDSKSYEIQNYTNQYLFSIVPNGTMRFNASQLYLTGFLYFLGLVFLLLTLYRRMNDYREESSTIKMTILMVILFIIYWIHVIFGIPVLLNHLEIFSAKYYAYSKWLPSLGDFFLIATLFFFWSLVFVKEFALHGRRRGEGEKGRWGEGEKGRKGESENGERRGAPVSGLPTSSLPFPVSGLRSPVSGLPVSPSPLLLFSFLFAAALYQLAGLMIGNLIRNSNITYKLNRITDIDQYSISSHLAIALLLFSVFLIHMKIIERTEHLIDKRTFLKFHLLAVTVSILTCVFINTPELYLLALFLGVNLLQSQIKKMHITRFSLSYAILFISLFSVVSLMVIYKTVDQRDIQVQKLMAVNLSSEQDPVAEVFLTNMQNQFDTDTVIPKLLTPPYIELENYLNRNYFDGYFRKYDIQYTNCTSTDLVIIQPDNVSQPCFPYFDKMITQAGTRLPGTSFYLMNNMEGKVSYLGKLHYPLANVLKGFSIYITMTSKTISEGIGFPELLMDKTLIKPFRYKYLSFAKYFDDELVNRSGEYTYNYYLQSYHVDKLNAEFELRKWDGYDHIIYKSDDKTFIIVSNRSLRFVDYLLSFPYIFVFYFAFVLSITMAGNRKLRKLIIPRDLRFRIQVAIISVVLISLLFVAAGTIYYNVKEYQNRHQSDLQEKMNSISVEIDSRLNNVNSIAPELSQWLYEELYKLSNTFKTDITIYDVKGDLIASSRPEIFRKGITSEKMNAEAYFELSEKYQLNYFQPEKIGNLSYLSAYEPILNNRGDYLGYLNLPYFTRQDEMKQGISTFVVAFINLYLLLFLASVIVAVVLSNKITLPLSLIREKLKGIQLGKKSEQIHYEAQDEIGALVREYNHKVDELAESAELLAKSERESAWREMAKQVAHEIKNPLTPMKLNIQYLQRAKAEQAAHFDDFFDRVTQNLIEQIDTLSGIATEFSNFAQIPKAKNEVFDLIEVLKSVCELFPTGRDENLRFTFQMNPETSGKEVLIFADKEQLSRAFLNLIKNGIQSIPSEQMGEIHLTVQKKESAALIAISDNGIGISEEAQEHLFEPNFTTKTSGMGLGLSIVQNIIQSFGGNITYQTSATTGTTFFIEIPRYQSTPGMPES